MGAVSEAGVWAFSVTGRCEASHMMITGCHSQILIVILWIEDYHFFYFDVQALRRNTADALQNPVHVVYPSKTYEFDYFFSLEGFNHRYFLV
jgi:hypothetical protein